MPLSQQHSQLGRILAGLWEGFSQPLDASAATLERGTNSLFGSNFHSADAVNQARQRAFQQYGTVSPAGRFMGEALGGAVFAPFAPFRLADYLMALRPSFGNGARGPVAGLPPTTSGPAVPYSPYPATGPTAPLSTAIGRPSW